MAALWSEDIEGGTNGSNLTTSNTGFTFFSGTTPTASNTHAHGGTLAMFCNTTAANSQAERTWTAANKLGLRAYIYVTANPPSNTTLFNIRTAHTSPTQVSFVVVTTTGAVRLQNSSAVAVGTTTATLTLNAWNRIELLLDGSGSNVTGDLRVYSGADVENAVASFTTGGQVTGTVNASALSPGDLLIGIGNAVTWSMYLDDMAGDNATFPGPTVTTNNWTATVTDNTGVTDNLAKVQNKVVTDTTGNADDLTQSLGAITRTQTDAENLTDAGTPRTVTVTVTEDVRLADATSTAGGVQPTVNVTGNEGITDSGLTTLQGQLRVDPMGLSDNVSVVTAAAVAWAATVTDSVGVFDTDQDELVVNDQIQDDKVNLTDSIVTIVKSGLTTSISGLVGVADSLSFDRAVSPTDTIGLTDSLTTAQIAGTNIAAVINDDVVILDSNQVDKNLKLAFLIDDTGLVDPFGVAFSTVLEDDTGLDDPMDVGDFPPNSLFDSMGISDSLSTSQATVLKFFTTPHQDFQYPTGTRLFDRMKPRRGLTVYSLDGGSTWKQSVYPYQALLSNANPATGTLSTLVEGKDYFLGGHTYPITLSQAAVLTAAGYGSDIT